MIYVDSPTVGCTKYLKVADCFIGPFGQSGKYESDKLEVDITDFYPTDVFREARGVCNENNILHEHFTGGIFYNPMANAIQKTPSALYPEKALAPFGVAPHMEECMYGVFGEGAGRLLLSANGYASHYVAAVGTGADWHIYKLQMHPFQPGHATKLNEWYIHINYVEGSRANYTLSSVSWPSGYVKIDGIEVNAAGVANASGIYRSKCIQAGGEPTGSTTQGFGGIFNFRPIGTVNHHWFCVNALADLAQFRCAELRHPDEMHYGDLCKRAISQVTAITINMIEFLSDLRHPISMLPNLRMLRKHSAKDLASGLLSTEYGLLPTISDLEAIWAAKDKMKPYLDKEGHSTYSARHEINDVTPEGVNINIVQHAKVAINERDDILNSIFRGLDNYGAFPTLQNLWDLVPYSFVMDWFLHVGDYLSIFDMWMRYQRYGVVYATMSRRQEIYKIIPYRETDAYSGDLRLVRYDRWVTINPPLPPPPLKPITPETVESHWLEAGALIIQRL